MALVLDPVCRFVSVGDAELATVDGFVRLRVYGKQDSAIAITFVPSRARLLAAMILALADEVEQKGNPRP